MKKIFITFILSFCIMYSASAAPIYGPKMPEKQQFFVGGQTHWVVRRDLEKEYGKMRSLQHFLLITYGVTDWLSIDLKGGAGNIKQNPTGSNEIDYPTALGGGYGFRLRVYEGDRSKVVFGFQHISIHPETIKVATTKHKSVLDDWQFSLLASYAFSRATPYVGTRWSRMDRIHWVNGNRKRERSDLTKSVGVIAGVDIPVTERVWMNVEGSVLDSKSIAFSINMAF